MKARSSLSQRLLFSLGPLGLLLLLSGCQAVQEESLTAKLWHSETFRNFNEPAPNPNVKLFQHPGRGDLLVQYDEVREKDGAVRTRAFFLNRNLERLQAGRKPRFVSAKAARTLQPVPVLARRQGELPPGTGLHVTASEDSQTFTLHANGRIGRIDTFRLPTYETDGGKLQRTLLTPLAVTGDVVIVGLYSAAVAAVVWLRVGAPGCDCH